MRTASANGAAARPMYREHGALIVDASRELDEVVDDVIKAVEVRRL